jgi:hypothetical protein
MAHTTHLHLHEAFLIRRVLHWHHQTQPGALALITMAPHTTLRLLRREQHHVHWCPPGERGVTMPLDEAVQRLRMLRAG